MMNFGGLGLGICSTDVSIFAQDLNENSDGSWMTTIRINQMERGDPFSVSGMSPKKIKLEISNSFLNVCNVRYHVNLLFWGTWAISISI